MLHCHVLDRVNGTLEYIDIAYFMLCYAILETLFTLYLYLMSSVVLVSEY